MSFSHGALSGTEGLVAVARNPVSAEYLKHSGAPGAISMCIDLGMAMADAIHHRLGFDPHARVRSRCE